MEPRGARPKDPKGVDELVGGRVRKRRRELQMSPEELAEKVGCSQMHITRYEAGLRRMASARLFDISQALGVPVAYFFSDLDNQDPDGSNGEREEAEKLAEMRARTAVVTEIVAKLALIAANIKDPETRGAVRDLLKGLPDLNHTGARKRSTKK